MIPFVQVETLYKRQPRVGRYLYIVDDISATPEEQDRRVLSPRSPGIPLSEIVLYLECSRHQLSRTLFETMTQDSMEVPSLLAQETLLRDRSDSSDPISWDQGVSRKSEFFHNSVSALLLVSFLPFFRQHFSIFAFLTSFFQKSRSSLTDTTYCDHENH